MHGNPIVLKMSVTILALRSRQKTPQPGEVGPMVAGIEHCANSNLSLVQCTTGDQYAHITQANISDGRFRKLRSKEDENRQYLIYDTCN
jgi:hypothetical protein